MPGGFAALFPRVSAQYQLLDDPHRAQRMIEIAVSISAAPDWGGLWHREGGPGILAP